MSPRHPILGAAHNLLAVAWYRGHWELGDIRTVALVRFQELFSMPLLGADSLLGSNYHPYHIFKIFSPLKFYFKNQNLRLLIACFQRLEN